MKKITLILLFVHFVTSSFSQSDNLRFCVRVPIQYEQQKAETSSSLGTRELKGTAVNFGVDVLVSYRIEKITFYGGVGYFRNKFNIKREYDHQALNVGLDSLPIGTDAKYYTYSLFRVPVGIDYKIAKFKDIDIGIGIEHLFNFSFKRKYEGRVPFENAKNKYNSFAYFGNIANFFFNFHKDQLEIEPYVRFYNKYKKDKFLKENENETTTRHFDALGINIRYLLKL